uniref:Uncharacterized protein n=1 Tax=Tanacetum cinerariifolium TaxID=118510 RepID=A0A6L2L5Q5_TANCI|nr:hypothetical protein [Tanacetum cinerariifolium]
MQEFWATATVHHHSIRFKMDNKKHIVNLESFREMLHICPRLPGQAFVEPPFEKEILAFLHFLGHSGAIRRITDVEHIDTKKSNEMYYPRFTKPATTSKAKSLSALSEVAMTKAQQLKLATKRSIQQTHISQASGSGADERTGDEDEGKDGDGDDEGNDGDDGEEGDDDNDDEQDDDEAQDDDDQDDKGNDKDDEEEGSDNEQASDEEEFIHLSLSTHAEEERRDEESFNPILKTPENTDDEGNGEENLEMNIGREEGQDEEDEADKLYRDSSSVSSQIVTSMLNPTPGAGMESIFKTTSQIDVQTLTSVAPLYVSGPTLTPSIIATIATTLQAPTTPTTVSSALLQDLPNFGSLFGFDHRLKTLEANFSEFTQTNQFAEAVSSIPKIVHRYMDQQMNEAVKVAVQIQSDRLRDEAQAENDEFLKTIVENMQKIIKEQVKEQVKNSYAVAADLSKMELKKILIEKMEGNKSIHRSNKQRNLYKALVEAYESNKIILDTYGDTVTLKRRCDNDADKYEEPSAGSDRGSKRRREGKEPEELAKLSDSRSSFNELMDTPVDLFAFLMNRLKVDILTPELLAGPTYELMKGSCKSLVELEFFLEEVYKATTDQLDWVNPEGQQYPHNLLKPLPLIPNNRGRLVIPFDHSINNDLEYLHGDASSCKYTTSVTKTKAADYGHIKDDDKLYKFKEGDFKRLRIQYIKDMLLLLVQGNLTNLIVEERFAFNKKLNLTKPDTYRSDLKRKEAYIAYSNPRGFIYQNKDKQNRLMRIDELHKFSDGTLTDVCTALDDRLKGIQMKYLPQSI